jgi:hypothetical protein
MFAWYRRLVLAEYQITYLNYGISLIEALVLAKVILLGDLLHLGRRFQEKPLIIPTLYKTAVFSIFVLAFALLEHICEGFLHGRSIAAEIHLVMSQGKDELLARCLVMFSAFVPFFAFQEIGRALGEGRVFSLFFKADQTSCSDFLDSGS